jgi:Gpi18-like mannosyltransferase
VSVAHRIRTRPAETALVAGLFAIVLLVRWAGRHELTYDMLVFLRWYGQLRDAGGVRGLGKQVGNYNAPYLYLLVLTTYLPGVAMLKIKAMYVAFDALLAFFAYKLVALRRPGHVAIGAALAVLLLPTVVINASLWGQMDSMWASFALGGLYFVLRERPWWAVTFCTIAFAFKPQGIFIFPLLLLCLLAGRLRWRALIAAPLVFVLLDLPAILLGRNPIELFTLYEPSRQAKYTTTALDAHAPSVFAFLPVGGRLETVKILGYGFTAALVLFVCYALISQRVRLTPTRLVTAATLFAIMLPYTLPGMHDRYFYLGDVLSVVLACYRPRLWFVPLLVQAASLGSYLPSLFSWYHNGRFVPIPVLAAIMGAALLTVGYVLLRDAVPALEADQAPSKDLWNPGRPVPVRDAKPPAGVRPEQRDREAAVDRR